MQAKRFALNKGNPEAAASGLCLFLFQHIQYNVNRNEHGDRAAEDGVHRGDGDLIAEEIEVAVKRVPEGFDNLGGQTVGLHFEKNSAHRVITQKRGSVGSGQEGYYLLKPVAER